MRGYTKILLGIAALTVVAAVVYKGREKKKCGNMLTEISDHGYETAHDVLYPHIRGGNSNLHYGPVLPR